MMNESPKGKMKLGKLAMPKKKSEMEMELGGEEMAELDEAEMPDSLGGLMGEESEGPEMEMEMESSEDMGPASSLSDEELLAELRKRGLSGKASKAASKASSDDEYLA
jgi:hypothetical protein